MLGIVCHWELPASLKPKLSAKKWAMLWTHTAKAFGVDTLVFITGPESELILGDTEIAIEYFETFKEFNKKYNKTKIITIEQGGEPLGGFVHPRSCFYVFGSNYGEAPVGTTTVSIPTKRPVHAEIAAGIVLSNRGLL